MYIKGRIIEDFRFDDKPLFMVEGLSRPDGSLRTTRLITALPIPSPPNTDTKNIRFDKPRSPYYKYGFFKLFCADVKVTGT